MVSTSSISVSPPYVSSVMSSKPRFAPNSSLSTTSPLSLPTPNRTHHYIYHNSILVKKTHFWRISGVGEDVLVAEATVADNSEQIVSTDGDAVSNTISVLLFIAFVGLSILTIGVIYIAVTDYLQKREKEKFEKEEAPKKKKGGKKRKVRARAGPRGFGQKVDEGDDGE